ncbi:MAG: PEP-CTERM sorting domain-containing protein [Anaerolineae bacterium]|nr:PEP-CTERM sorting domain-containing protein [Phycisphaerae bacterium]
MRVSNWASIAAAVVIGLSATATSAATLSEGFAVVGNGTTTGLAAVGWRFSNQSTLASANFWRQGVSANGPAPDGPATSYAIANFTDTTSTAATGATISQWMITPVQAFNGGDHTITFKTRTATGNPFPDRLQVRLSTTTNATGTLPEDVGSFTTLLLDINPNELTGAANYPDTYLTQTINLSGASVPANGFVAFRYYVHNAGANGANSNLIGFDTLNIVPVPEPTAMGLIGLVGAGMIRRRRSA